MAMFKQYGKIYFIIVQFLNISNLTLFVVHTKTILRDHELSAFLVNIIVMSSLSSIPVGCHKDLEFKGR